MITRMALFERVLPRLFLGQPGRPANGFKGRPEGMPRPGAVERRQDRDREVPAGGGWKARALQRRERQLCQVSRGDLPCTLL